MRSTARLLVILSLFATVVGCKLKEQHPKLFSHQVCKTPTGRVEPPICNNPLLEAARCVTRLEDELRREGTISVKTPDVWGDSNLMHSIQEFDQEMTRTHDKFGPTLQAIDAASDATKVQTETTLAAGLEGTAAPTVAAGQISPTSARTAVKDLIGLTSAGKLSVEPTELERQHATYVYVNQALRRRNMGGDNTRKAGYGLYMFRIPVSVLPGEETNQGYSAIASFRAKLNITPADVKYTLPRMAIADLVDKCSARVHYDWDKPTISDKLKAEIARIKKHVKENPVSSSSLGLVTTNLSILSNSRRSLSLAEINSLLGSIYKAINADTSSSPNTNLPSKFLKFESPVRQALVDQSGPFETATPKISATGFEPKEYDAIREFIKEGRLYQPATLHETRHLMFEKLSKVHVFIEKRNGYTLPGMTHPFAIIEAAEKIQKKESTTHIEDFWLESFGKSDGGLPLTRTAWLLARQCGETDLSIKQLMEEMSFENKMSQDEIARVQNLNFFNPADLAETTLVWQRIVEQRFPLEVFTLEPQVEEQNLLDSTARIREMQMALAVSVAQGTWNAGQKVALARELARETAAIGVNRTAVGFVHGNDTFGWYFHPRAQASRLPISNRSAFRETIFPGLGSRTASDDRSTHRLEPGVRECEVLVAMPNFVSRVEFDVTTNWESLNNPGRSKNSYEEMVSQGAMLQQARDCLCPANCGPEYREGDISRLNSRVDQLENMLSMQTVGVSIPYESDQAASDLFDQSADFLVPELHGYYGLKYLVADDKLTADFFITGRNFHPTLTHVIVGGHESHALEDSSNLEILSRELMRVRTTLTNEKLSGDDFIVRVGTPAGLSDPIKIKKAAKAPKSDPPPSDFDWKKNPEYTAIVYDSKTNLGTTETALFSNNKDVSEFEIVPGKKNPFKLEKFLNDNNDNNDKFVQLVNQYDIEFTDGTKSDFRGVEKTIDSTTISDTALKALIKNDMDSNILSSSPREGKIVVTTYMRLDEYSYTKLGTPFTITLKPKQKEVCIPTTAPTAPLQTVPVIQPTPATPPMIQGSAQPISSTNFFPDNQFQSLPAVSRQTNSLRN